MQLAIQPRKRNKTAGQPRRRISAATPALRHRVPNALARVTLLICTAVGAAMPVGAQDVPDFAPEFGRYLPLYPGQYLDVRALSDDRDSVFDSDGQEVDGTVPTQMGRTEMPRTDVLATMRWHFPWFEESGIPWLSSTTHFANVNLRYAKTETNGSLAAFIRDDSDDASTEADDLRNNGSGLGDVLLEFGSFLYGAHDWRTRERTPLAVLAKVGLNLNYGNYDRDAPTSAGSNTPHLAFHLGVHAQPWPGGIIDAGVGFREYFKNQDPAFGGLAPSQQGDDTLLDVSIAQRLFAGAYLTAFYTDRDGDPNIYDRPRFAPNPPPPNPNSDNFPTPDRYTDNGTSLRTAGLSLHYFALQRLRLGLSIEVPLDGNSGAFDLPYTDRTPAGCTVGATGCTTTDGDVIRADAYGPARVFASNRIMLSGVFHFGEGDTFNCTGCRQ